MNAENIPVPTHVAILTAPGHGALATIGVRGPTAERIVLECLTQPVALQARAARPWLRHFRSVRGSTEELVVAFPAANEARLHCHGGEVACEAVVAALEREGAVRIDWPEWNARQGGSALEAAARLALSQAPTERTALILLDQLQGAFEQEVREIHGLLADERSESAARTTAAEERLRRLLRRAELGQHLTEPWKIVIAGEPNAGKSSLLNALLGYQRSIISPRPGTTRDVVTARTAIAGWPVELRDTAGQRASVDPLEAIGVELAQREQATADLVLLVVPANQDAPSMVPGSKTLVVRSKADLLASNQGQTADGAEIVVSAQSGQGLGELLAAIEARLVPDVPPAGAAVPWTKRQQELLGECCRWLRADLDRARECLSERLHDDRE